MCVGEYIYINIVCNLCMCMLSVYVYTCSYQCAGVRGSLCADSAPKSFSLSL